MYVCVFVSHFFLWFDKGYGQTISAPHMHALALELLKDHAKYVLFTFNFHKFKNNWTHTMIDHLWSQRPGAKVLDVGSGSGYLSACFAAMVKLIQLTLTLQQKTTNSSKIAYYHMMFIVRIISIT
jgi:protein-L-isoaspartate O-methyltransferase